MRLLTINAQLLVFRDKVAVHNAAAIGVFQSGDDTLRIVPFPRVAADHLLVQGAV